MCGRHEAMSLRARDGTDANGFAVRRSALGLLRGSAALFLLSSAASSAGIALIEAEEGVLCHAALIGSRTALTVEHCLDGSDISDLRVLIVESGERRSVVAAEPERGATVSALGDAPVRLTLDRAHEVGHLSAGPGLPRSALLVPGQPKAVVSVALEIVTRDGPLWFVYPSLCDGASGAPALDGRGRVVAVVLGVTAPDCHGGLKFFIWCFLE